MASNRPAASKISKLNEGFRKQKANQGHGSLGKWPETNKEIAARLVGMTLDWEAKIEDYSIQIKTPDGDKNKTVDGFKVQFSYEADTPDGVLSFKGVPKAIAFDSSELSGPKEGKKWGPREFNDDMLAKLKGDIEGLLGPGTASELDVALSGVEQMIEAANSGGSPLHVCLFLEERKRKYKDKKTGTEKEAVDRHDFIRSTISAPEVASDQSGS
jgi:hypothetical protein